MMWLPYRFCFTAQEKGSPMSMDTLTAAERVREGLGLIGASFFLTPLKNLPMARPCLSFLPKPHRAVILPFKLIHVLKFCIQKVKMDVESIHINYIYI
jgi:hypothetical protein